MLNIVLALSKYLNKWIIWSPIASNQELLYFKNVILKDMWQKIIMGYLAKLKEHYKLILYAIYLFINKYLLSTCYVPSNDWDT